MKLNRAQRQAEEWKAKAEAAEADKDALKGRLLALNEALADATKLLDAAQRSKKQQKKQLAEARRNDRQTAEWSDARVPDPVRGVLKSGKKHRKRK